MAVRSKPGLPYAYHQERSLSVKSDKFTTNLIFFMLTVLLIAGCATQPKKEFKKSELDMLKISFKGNPIEKKDIFVFFDGTRNTPESETNVYRLYKLIKADNADQVMAIYLNGVGSPEDEPILGSALGKGMEKRILAGYEYLITNYKPNDNIYIFGFSRGAHQARALAGLIAYTGILDLSEQISSDMQISTNRIIELVKKKSDKDYIEQWKAWSPGQPPPLAKVIDKKLGYEVRPAEITFLGVWDTVPGSSLKNYGACKEQKGIFKKYLFWMIPGVDKGERYKSDSYPPIKKIVHVMSVDEKRSKFRPIQICDPISPAYTDVEEVWFPGAHADVGGGYKNQFELPNLSLGWMIKIFAENYRFKGTVPKITGNPRGLAHWSIGDAPANIGSVCEDRVIPADATIHESVDERKNAGKVSIRIEENNVKMIKDLDYPINCPE